MGSRIALILHRNGLIPTENGCPSPKPEFQPLWSADLSPHRFLLKFNFASAVAARKLQWDLSWLWGRLQPSSQSNQLAPFPLFSWQRSSPYQVNPNQKERFDNYHFEQIFPAPRKTPWHKKKQTFNKQKIDDCSQMTAFVLFIPKDPQSLWSMK